MFVVSNHFGEIQNKIFNDKSSPTVTESERAVIPFQNGLTHLRVNSHTFKRQIK